MVIFPLGSSNIGNLLGQIFRDPGHIGNLPGTILCDPGNIGGWRGGGCGNAVGAPVAVRGNGAGGQRRGRGEEEIGSGTVVE